MAKSGQQAREFVRQHQNGAVQKAQARLERARMTDEQAREAQERLELANGLRCAGCGRRIGRGFQFTSIGVRDEVSVIRLSACAREDCDFAARAREGATYVEQVEHVWLDEEGMDAPTAKVVQERIDQQAAEAAATGETA